MRQFYRSFAIKSAGFRGSKQTTGISASIPSESSAPPTGVGEIVPSASSAMTGAEASKENQKDMTGNIKKFNSRAWGLEASIDETAIGAISSVGDGFFVLGPKIVRGDIIALPDTVLNWKRNDGSNVFDPERYTLLGLIVPKFDLVVVGTGAKTVLPLPQQRAEIRKVLRNVPVEFMSTVHAAATFNMLSKEGSRITACLSTTPNNS